MASAEIAATVKMAMGIQQFAKEKKWDIDLFMNAMVSLVGLWIKPLSRREQEMVLMEIKYVAGMEETPLKRFN